MSKIKIITDTASDIPLYEAEIAGIDMLSFTLSIDGKSYQEQRDLSKEEFYQLMSASDDMPSTSQITAFTFQETFQRYYEEGYTDLIYVGINEKGSATLRNAEQAKNMLFEEFPDAKEKIKIHILDSGNYTISYGYPVLMAAEMASHDIPIENILHYLRNWIADMGVYFVPMTLKYVRKSGRLTAAAAFAGEVLGLRPIIHISHGEIAVSEKVRGEKNIVPKLVDKALSVMKENSPYLIVEGSNPVYADQAEALLKEKTGRSPAYRAKVGSAVSINAGHDLCAVIVLEK